MHHAGLVLVSALAAVMLVVCVCDPVRWYHRRRLEQSVRTIQDACRLARARAVAGSCETEVTVQSLDHQTWAAMVRYPRDAGRPAEAAAYVVVTQRLPRGVTSDRVYSVAFNHDARPAPLLQQLHLTSVHGRRYWRRSLLLPPFRDHARGGN